MSEPLEQNRPKEGPKTDDSPADLAASLWARPDRPVKSVEQGKPGEPEANRWTASKTEKDSVHRLSLKSFQEIDVTEFRIRNPDAPVDLQAAVGRSDFKVRHLATEEIDGGWKLESVERGRLRLTKSYEIDVAAKKSHDGVIESMQGVDPGFVAKLERKLLELPPNVLSNLRASGYKIIAAPTIGTAIPELERMTPRGWPKSSTFDNSDGTHENVRRLIIAPMRVKVDGDWAPVSRPDTLIHHVGHALDYANAKLSESAEFQRAFKLDMGGLPDRQHHIAEYFSQGGGRGAEECFASLFGLALTGPENEADRAYLSRKFPNSMEVVRAQIKGLR